MYGYVGSQSKTNDVQLLKTTMAKFMAIQINITSTFKSVRKEFAYIFSFEALGQKSQYKAVCNCFLIRIN